MKTTQNTVTADVALKALEAAAVEWEQRATSLRAAIESARGQLKLAGRGYHGGAADTPRGAVRKSPTGKGAAAVTVEILKEWGRPARVGDIMPELAKRGVHVGGKRPAQTLASTLLKYPGLRRVSRGLFVVK